MEQFLDDVKTFFTDAGLNIVIGLLIIAVGLLICKIVKTVLKRLLKRAKRDEAVVSFVVSLTDVVLKIVVFVSALATMGVNTASIITVLGTAGVAVGLALKDSLGNLASGLIIIVNKPFKKDDYVEVGGVAGTIVSINLFNTTLVTYDNKKIILPNSTAVNNPVVNYDGCETRRVDIEVAAPKGIALERVKNIVAAVADADERVSKKTPYSVRLTSQTADSIVLTLRAWCADKLYWDVLNDLNEGIYTAFAKEGILTPNKQIDVHVSPEEPTRIL